VHENARYPRLNEFDVDRYGEIRTDIDTARRQRNLLKNLLSRFHAVVRLTVFRRVVFERKHRRRETAVRLLSRVRVRPEPEQRNDPSFLPLSPSFLFIFSPFFLFNELSHSVL